jgi:hypothetical protein
LNRGKILCRKGKIKCTRKALRLALRVRFSFYSAQNGRFAPSKVFEGSLRGTFFKKSPSKKLKKLKN